MRLSSVAVALATLLASASAHAFCRSTTCSVDCERNADGCKVSGEPLSWPSMCVGFSMQRDGTQWIPMADVLPIVHAAFAEWSDRDCDGGGQSTIAFVELDMIDCHEAEHNPSDPNANVILFQDSRWTYTDADNTLAKTTVTYDTATGEIFDADIEINHAHNGYTLTDPPGECSAANDCYDLQSVLTHEIGHFIGLDHTKASTATMNAGYTRATTELRSLEPDDVDAVCGVYPPGREATCDAEPRNGLGNECASDGCGCSMARRDWGWPMLAGLLVLLRYGAARQASRSGRQRASRHARHVASMPLHSGSQRAGKHSKTS